MPWQRHVLDVALELDEETGKLVYREVILTVPRQSGKTTLLLVLILLRALSAPRQNIRYTAQTGADARKKWHDDWLPVLKPTRFARLFKIRLTNGHEALLFRNGSMQGLVATTKKTGHGGTLDLAILDESFAHPDARLEQALKPAMITRPQPQLWIVSTAGTPEDSPFLWSKVQGGRECVDAGLNHSICYFEWSPDDDAPADDPATWWSCMPALGITITEDAVAADYRSMSADGKTNEFERAYLNRWKTATSDPVIPLRAWAELADLDSQIAGRPVLAFDVSPDRSQASISAAGRRADGFVHIELVDRRSGTAWVADRLAELIERHEVAAVMCDPKGPAGALLPDLAQKGLTERDKSNPSGLVVTMSAQEHAQACGMLYDAVTDGGTLRHLGQAEMTAAIDGGAKRPLGDAWAWDRKNSNVDITPLVSATLAHFGVVTEPSSGPGVWDLTDIVERLRKQAADEPDDRPGPRAPAEFGGGVTFHAF